MAKYDMKTLEEVRKDYCELCGRPAYGWPHHIKTRGAGGKETRWNLIQLCGEHHDLAQQYKIPRRKLVEIVALREGMTVEEIYEKNNWLLEGKLPDKVPVSNPVAGKTLEEVIELYMFCLEKGEASMWERAAVITVMHDCLGMKPRQIGGAIGCSSSLVRKMNKVFNTFPEERDRLYILSFRHHQIASNTGKPGEWLKKAADNQWSTRQMLEHITSSDMSEEGKKDKQWEKAEKALLLMQEVIGTSGDPADWLIEELKRLLPVTMPAAS